MVKIFYDPQGNAQLATDFLIDVVANQPDVFSLADISDEDYEKILKGAKYIDGEIVEPLDPKDIVLTTEESKEIMTKAYKKQLDEYKDSLSIALLRGDDEMVNSIREEYENFHNTYMALLEGDDNKE